MKGLFRHSPRYRSFIKDRDRALEYFLISTQKKNSNVLRGTFRHILLQAKLHYTQLIGPNYQPALQMFAAEVNAQMAYAQKELAHNIILMRKLSYFLSRASEVEAISQATNRPHKNEVPIIDLNKKLNEHSVAGGNLTDRIGLYLSRLSSKIINNAHAACLARSKDVDGNDVPLDQESFLLRIYYAFPKTRSAAKPRRNLKSHLYEADNKAKVDISQDFIDERSWKEMVDEYLKDIPTTRGPDEIVGKKLTPEGEEETYYAWELERDTTKSLFNRYEMDKRTGQNLPELRTLFG